MLKYKGLGAVTADQWSHAASSGRIEKTIDRIQPEFAAASVASLPVAVADALSADLVTAIVEKAIRADADVSRAILSSVADRIAVLCATAESTNDKVDSISRDIAAIRASTTAGAEAVEQMRGRIRDLAQIADMANAARVASMIERDKAIEEAKHAVDDAASARAEAAAHDSVARSARAHAQSLEEELTRVAASERNLDEAFASATKQIITFRSVATSALIGFERRDRVAISDLFDAERAAIAKDHNIARFMIATKGGVCVSM